MGCSLVSVLHVEHLLRTDFLVTTIAAYRGENTTLPSIISEECQPLAPLTTYLWLCLLRPGSRRTGKR